MTLSFELPWRSKGRYLFTDPVNKNDAGFHCTHQYEQFNLLSGLMPAAFGNAAVAYDSTTLTGIFLRREPLQWFAVQGLQSYEHNKLAVEVMSRWLNTVDTYYKANHTLMEKYNVEDIATSASGGEYEVQHGFGWTNGVTQVFAKALRTGTPASPAL